MHNVFISYHHANDQAYKEQLSALGERLGIFRDCSVDTGDISDDLTDQKIREKIRDEYLRDTTVTILLVGTGTKGRKHVDWEIYSSMFDGRINKKSGIVVVNLPATACTYFTAAHPDEKRIMYPECSDWMTIDDRVTYEQRYPYLPARIIDNLLAKEAKISVTNWDRIADDPEKLDFLINAAFNGRSQCEYDMRREMRRSNSLELI